MDTKELLARVEGDIAAARSAVEGHRATWRHQCSRGVFGAAEATEDEIIQTERKLLRLTVRRDYLQEQIKLQPEQEVTA